MGPDGPGRCAGVDNLECRTPNSRRVRVREAKSGGPKSGGPKSGGPKAGGPKAGGPKSRKTDDGT